MARDRQRLDVEQAVGGSHAQPLHAIRPIKYPDQFAYAKSPHTRVM